MKKILLLVALLALILRVSAQEPVDTTIIIVPPPDGGEITSPTQDDAGTNYAPTEQDSIPMFSSELLTSKIHLRARAYGDRVYLRWVPEDYVSWLFLKNDGVNILRMKSVDFSALEGEDMTPEMAKALDLKIDTLAYALKPLTEEQMRAKYQPNDSNAMVAMGVLYGEGRKDLGQTAEKPGSMGANMEFNAEQDVSFGFAMLVAEWRPDLAQDLAVGFIDRTAEKGAKYDYVVQPTVTDTGGKIVFEPGVRNGIVNNPYKPRPYEVEIKDSLVAPQRFTLSWTDKRHASFEIDRREVTDAKKNTAGPWQRINDKPYMSMAETDFEGLSLMSDSVPYDGTWEYRIMAHDEFGELTEPSPVHRVYARDIKAPLPPQLKVIYIDRPEEDPMARINARVVWTNPEVQDADCKGYLLKYYNEELYGSQWHFLTDDYIPPTDTLYTVDVTGLRTGLVCLSAYDESGNESESLAQLIRITDYKAPTPPDSLQCVVLDAGYAILTWKPSPEDDDIAYFDVAYANAPDHEFLRRNQLGINENGYVDTLALDVNQKYIYYKVRAVDWSNNVGEWSPYIQVMRPHNTPPTQPHLDTSSHDDKTGMHMDWVVGKDADMAFHLLYRRVGEKGDWEVIRRWDADSLAMLSEPSQQQGALPTTNPYVLHVDDNPSHNRQERYYYMVESFNSSPFTSQSLAVSWLHQGPKYFDIPLKLFGDWMKNEKHARLTWEVGTMPATLKDQPYYYCVFRKTSNDKRFRYVTNVPSTEMEFDDASLAPGEKAEYYIMIRFEDGRESQQSNTVTMARE
jgi:hypothetical protein